MHSKQSGGVRVRTGAALLSRRHNCSISVLHSIRQVDVEAEAPRAGGDANLRSFLHNVPFVVGCGIGFRMHANQRRQGREGPEKSLYFCVVCAKRRCASLDTR
jgi:hypothetical protein